MVTFRKSDFFYISVMIWVYVILKIHINNFIDDSNFLTFQFRQNSKMHKTIIGLFSLQRFN